MATRNPTGPDAIRPAALKPVRRIQRTLRQIALDQMRDAILRSELKPGDRLVERTLCAQLGVSRSIIREVLRCLEGEGLVRDDGSGPAVSHPTATELEQIYELRALLEAMAASRCAGRATRTQLAGMEKSLDAINAAYEEGNPTSVLKHTHRYYHRMFQAAGCDVAWELVQALQGRISFYRALSIAAADRRISGMQELRAIQAAIRAGDVAGADQVTRDHVAAAARIALNAFAARD